jgi:putative (di)nucleoside polyphosphate hydrolase
LLAFERSDLSGEWQLPQGGIESGESPEQAVWRELAEETGLDGRHVALVGEYDGWTAYMWPEPMRRGERLGQAHRWFFFEPIVEPIVPVPDGTEFSDWTWMEPSRLVECVVDFRKPPYRQVLGG